MPTSTPLAVPTLVFLGVLQASCLVNASGIHAVSAVAHGSVPPPGPPTPLGPPPAPAGATCGGFAGPVAGKVNVACVGDSITFGAHSSGGNTTYPGQLQIMLDTQYPGKYCVTNLGQSGATMQKRPNGDAPWWDTPKYKQWTDPANAKLWDKVVIMLGTNDAKDACPAEGCPASVGCGNASFCVFNRPGSCCNWPHPGQTSWVQDCTDGVSCPFAKTYGEMIAVARTLGKQPAGPEIWLAVPPPLIAGGSPGSPAKPYGMNQTVINDILPVVIPKINLANKLPHPPINVFGAMGGSSGLECGYGPKEDTPNLCGHKCTAPSVERSNSSGCSLQCDAQSCDPCHPNDQGYTVLAATIMKGMGL